MRWLLLGLLVLSGCIKDCGTCALENCGSVECFFDKSSRCSRAKLDIEHDGNVIRLTTRGVWFGKCRISLKLQKINITSINPNMARMAEGKTLNCGIPLDIVSYNSTQLIEGVMNLGYEDYCTGPIKDYVKIVGTGTLREKLQ